MSLFPWDDWFYHISRKERELEELYNQYVNQKATIITEGQVYDKTFHDLQSLMIYNYALLIIAHQSNMKELDFKEFWSHIQNLPPPQKYDATAFQIVEGTSELIGTGAFGKVVYNASSPYIKAAFRSVKNWATSSGESAVEEATDITSSELEEPLLDAGSDAMADLSTDMGLDEAGTLTADAIGEAGEGAGEVGTEIAIEATGEAVAEGTAVALSTVVAGAAIFVAVGLDAIMGAIQGKKEEEAIEKQRKPIQNALDIVDKYLNKLKSTESSMETKCIKMMDLFKVNLVILENTVMPLGMKFDLKTPSTMGNMTKFKTAMQKAVTTYGYLSTIRHNWENFKAHQAKRHPGRTPSWELFSEEQEDMAPITLTDKEIDAMLKYAKAKIDS